MGASGWHYFTPYREDVGQALEELRQRVFRSGEYGDWWQVGRMTDAELAALPPALRDVFTKRRDDIRSLQASRPPPATIDEALQRAGEEGTHTILDICRGLSAGPGLTTAFPMPDDLMLAFFGTTCPTREQVEANRRARDEGPDRWECWYVVAYKDGRPDEIYFEGSSGD